MKKHLLIIGCTLAASLGGAQPATALPYHDSYCREFTRPVNVGGQLEDAYGTACLQPDGSWRIVGDDRYDGLPVVQHVTVINRSIAPVPVYISKQRYFTAREVIDIQRGNIYRPVQYYSHQPARRASKYDRRGHNNHRNRNRWR